MNTFLKNNSLKMLKNIAENLLNLDILLLMEQYRKMLPIPDELNACRGNCWNLRLVW